MRDRERRHRRAAIMNERCATPRPHRPSWESTTGSRTPCSFPRASPCRRGDPARRGLGQGEPLRLRARLPRGRDRRARLRRAWPRGLGRRASGPGAIDDALAMVELLRAHAPRVALRGSSMGGFWRSMRARSDAAICAVVAICPAPEDGLLRFLRSGQELAVPAATRRRATLARVAQHVRRGREPGPRDRPAAVARARRRAGARTRSASGSTRRPASRSACCSCPAATTARCSTTSSCRPCRAGSSAPPPRAPRAAARPN